MKIQFDTPPCLTQELAPFPLPITAACVGAVCLPRQQLGMEENLGVQVTSWFCPAAQLEECFDPACNPNCKDV